MLHEGIVELFRNRPRLAAELLRGLLQVPLGEDAERVSELQPVDFVQMKPVEASADLVVVFRNRAGVPLFAVVVEVQLRRKLEKRNVWPLYLASLRRRLGCAVYLLVIAVDPKVAAWCAEPIVLGHPGWVLTPLVIGPGAVPLVTSVAEARKAPELAVLSAMAHGREARALAVGRAAFLAAFSLGGDEGRLYADLVLASLSEAARRALEKQMAIPNYEYQSEWFRRLFAQGREQGLEQGREQGREQGLLTGRTAAKAEAILEVLRARGIELDDAAGSRIGDCRDEAVLDVWLRRAATAGSATEIFE